MSIELDWQIIDEETSPEPPSHPPPARSRPRRTLRVWLALTGLALLAAASAVAYWTWWTYRMRLNQAAEPVRQMAQLEAQVIAANDRVSFMALQDPDNPAWRAAQEKRFARLEREGLPEFGWKAASAPSPPGAVALEPGGARVDVTYRFSVTQPMPGGPVSVTLRVPQFYKPTPSGWVHAMPGPDFWGPWRKQQGQRVVVIYLQRDASVIEPLIPRLNALLERVCNPLPCPPQVGVLFENIADSLVHFGDPSYGFDEGVTVKFPSPHLTGVPADARSRDEFYRAVETRMVRALVYEASGRSLGMNHFSSQEIMRWELAQAGLTGPFITEAIVRALNDAMRRGAWQPLDMISSRSISLGAGVLPRDVMLPLALAFLEGQLGQGTVIRLLPAMTSSEIRTLGQAIHTTLRVNPKTLDPMWLTYLRQRAGLTVAESTPPDGELALECATGNGSSSIWRVRADGTSLTQLTSDRAAQSPAWSFDRQQLAYLQDGRVLIMDIRSRRYKTVAADHSISDFGWLPNPGGTGPVRLWVSIQGKNYVVDLETGQDFEIVGAYHAWSPDGARVAYVTYTPDPTIQIADADGRNTRLVAQGEDPSWSTDGKRLAFVSQSRVEPDWAIRIANAESGAVTTLAYSRDWTSLFGYTSEVRWVGELTWAPDNSLLAAQISNRAGWAILLLDTNSGDVRAWYVGGELRSHPWSPDSHYLVLEAPPNRLILNVQTNQSLMAPNHGGWDWSQDGQWLAVTQADLGVMLVTPDLSAMRWLDTPACLDVVWGPGS